MNDPQPPQAPRRRPIQSALALVERAGNRLPDPVLLFALALLLVWAASALLAGRVFTSVDPSSGAEVPLLHPRTGEPLIVRDLLRAGPLVEFFTGMVTTFVSFPPLGLVLVALLGVGVAEHTGLVRVGLRWMLSFTPRALLTPSLIVVAILSHSAGDAGFVLVIPLGAVMFQAAGRHPIAGIAAAFAGVSGGFSANPLPSSLDVLLQGFTQSAAQIIDPERAVNALCNWRFMGSTSVLIVLLGWWVTDRIVEPRVRGLVVDGDGGDPQHMGALERAESRGLIAAGATLAVALALMVWLCAPADSPLRDAGDGTLTSAGAPLMKLIVPLIFGLCFAPGVAYGIASGTVKSHRDVIAGMSASMSAMGYYIVLAFFCSLFLDAFYDSNLGALMAQQGALALRGLGLPPQLTIVGFVLVSGGVNLVIGSASAKWGLLSPIFVPMMMQLGLSPELTQAAYRIGDSTTNVITPLMPYFPLVVLYCRRYVKSAGIGTLSSVMLPYTVAFLLAWVALLLAFWQAGWPLGIDGGYVYP